MNYSILKLSALFAIVVLFASCQKETVELDVDSTQSQSDAEMVMGEMENDVLTRTIEENYAATGGTCPTITYQNTAGTFPNVIVIDWGTGCTGTDGRVRSGAIVVDVSDSHFTAGAVRTITSQNYTVNGWAVEGVRTVTNLGDNDQGQMQWNIVVNNASITSPDGDVASWTTDRIRTQTAGSETSSLADDSYTITGTASGVNRRGNAYTAVIVQPLIKNHDCRWISAGVIEVTGSAQKSRQLDYGDGTCDNKGTVTYHNGTEKEITLRR